VKSCKTQLIVAGDMKTHVQKRHRRETNVQENVEEKHVVDVIVQNYIIFGGGFIQ